jgi:O-acetyl-ADP-ribose deacetylase
MEVDVHGLTLEIVRGDITRQEDVECIVSGAESRILKSEGVSGAVQRIGGPQLTEAVRRMTPVRPGEAFITEGYYLPNDYVIHCRGPVYKRDIPADVLLVTCYRNILALAEKYHIETIALPALATGRGGYPFHEAAEMALHTVIEQAPSLKYVKRVRFVLDSAEKIVRFKASMNEITVEKELS